MKRILLMVFRNIIFVPYWFCQLLWYAAHTDSIPEEKKLALLKKIVAHANAGGNVTIKAYGTEHIPRDGSFMFYPNHQGLYDVLAIIDTCPRLFSVQRRCASVHEGDSAGEPGCGSRQKLPDFPGGYQIQRWK